MKAPCHRLCIACYLMIQLIDIIGHEIFLLADLIVLLLMDHNIHIFKSNITEHYCNRPASVPAAGNICLAQFATYHIMDHRKENIETIDAQPEVLTDDIIEIQHSNSNSSDSSYLPKRYH